MNEAWKKVKFILIIIIILCFISSLFSPSEATAAFIFFLVILEINVHWFIKILLIIAVASWNYGIGIISGLCILFSSAIYLHYKVEDLERRKHSTSRSVQKNKSESSRNEVSMEKLQSKSVKENYLNVLANKDSRMSKILRSEATKKPKVITAGSEIIDFFKRLEENKHKTIKDFPSDTYLSDSNFELFYSFVANTKERLDIITAFLEEDLLAELLYPLRNKPIRIRLIKVTRNVKNLGYLDYLNKNSKLSIETKNMSRNHSKMMIRDHERIIIGSSNITEASMSKKKLNYDANFLSEDKNDVNLAQKIFDSIWNQQSIIKYADENNSSLLYKKRSRSQLPKIIESLARGESNEIVLLFNSGLIDRRVIEKIRSYNSSPKIRIVTNKTWQDENMNEVRKETVEMLKHLSKNEENGIRVLPKKSLIHAKVYIFKSQNIALVTSQNLTVNSWYPLFETGYMIKDEKTIKKITKSINELPDSDFDSIEYYETEKPISIWTDSTSERTLNVPWELYEIDPEWKTKEDNNGSFYSVVKDVREKSPSDNVRVDYERIQTYESPIDEEWQDFKEAHPYPRDRILKRALFRLQKAEIDNPEEADKIREFIENYKSLRRKKRRGSKNNAAFNEEVLKRLREAGLDPSKLK